MSDNIINDVCIALNYYTPYVSGLTNVARDIAEGLAARGKKIIVVTSQHDKNLAKSEILNGVKILRTPVLFSLGKGVISPSFISTVLREARASKIINIHAPMIEAGVIAALCHVPAVITYQCDVSLPENLFGRIQNNLMDLSTQFAIRKSKIVTVTSDDYAQHSRIRNSLIGKSIQIPPTCHLRVGGQPKFRDGEGFHVGFLGRIVEEKGIEYLIEGFRAFDDKNARLLIGGEFKNLAGGGVIDKIRKKIHGDDRIKLLGFLHNKDIPDFYASLDVFALPSINPFEAIGIVQVEAMMVGVPVIASNLPGVRQPVFKTGMGVIVEPRSAPQITEALSKLKINRPDTQVGALLARQYYALSNVLDQFEDVLERATRL